jgi:hypothetical protein
VTASNPYSPPQAVVRDAPVPPGSAVKAVALGLVTDFGGTIAGTTLLGLLYGFAAFVSRGASGTGVDEALAVQAEFASTESWTFYANIMIGLSCSVGGGYVCARVARRNELKLGAVLAAIVTAPGVAFGGGDYSLILLLALSAAGILAIMGGAWLGLAKNRRIEG